MNAILTRDVNQLKTMDAIISEPSSVLSMDSAEVRAIVRGCLARLRTNRMGGRSASLVCLSVILWQMHKRNAAAPLKDLNVEALIAMAFQITEDPSYIQPEWGIVLVGVLIARHSSRLSRASKGEVLQQSRLLLQHLSENARNPSVRSSSRALLNGWKGNFRKGLDSVIQSGYREWPSSARFAKMPARDLDKKLKKVLYVLPAAYDKNDFALYRLFLERKGTWQLLQAVSLR